MDVPPLSLEVLHLTPHTLIPDPSDDPPTPSPVPQISSPTPSPPLDFALSPTHNYPSPFGTISLGSTLSLHVRLTNTRPDGGEVPGVKMMVEIQGPTGRYRLGEIVHGDKGEKARDEGGELPALANREGVDMEVDSEMKELGLHVLICSIAWETLDGRRTFQRFLKFNVNAPLAIKTRIHTSQDPNTSLDPIRRGDVSLEVLVQNVSTEGILFDRVQLEAVHGLTSKPIVSNDGTTLMPSDTRQYLFLLSPAPTVPSLDSPPKSVFPPVHTAGTILPLGRLDVAWFSGPYRDPGRLQTSTLNRRVPMPPIAPKPLPVPTRTLTAAPPSPATTLRRSESQVPPPLPARGIEEEVVRWEFDLAVLEVARDGVDIEKEFTVKLRVAIRDATPISNSEEASTAIPPRPVQLAVQYLTSRPPQPASSQPQLALSLPTGSATPVSPVSSRPFSPLSPSTPGAGPSRPMTPVSTQLRQATSQNLTSQTTPLFLPASPLPRPGAAVPFPPPPFLTRPVTHHAKRLPSQAMLTGEIAHLGVSLILLDSKDFHMVIEDTGTTYADPATPTRRWEALHELELRFIALQEGMSELGGLRLLVMEDDGGGGFGREWDTLGDVWVDG